VGERAAVGHLLATLGAIHLDTGNLEAARTAWTEALSAASTGRESFARTAALGQAKVAAILGDGPRLRALAEAATRLGPSIDEQRWELLAALGRTLAGDEAPVPTGARLEQIARAGPEGLLLVELLMMKRIERGAPEAEAQLLAVRRAAEQAGVDRHGVDRLLVRAAMA
jgi:hypothetical protein